MWILFADEVGQVLQAGAGADGCGQGPWDGGQVVGEGDGGEGGGAGGDEAAQAGGGLLDLVRVVGGGGDG